MNDRVTQLARRAAPYGRMLALPVSLALLFVFQNELFNYWIGLSPNPFLALSLAANLALGLLLYGPAILFRRNCRYAYLLTAASAASVLLVAQYLYHSYFGGFLEASALHYAGQAGDETGTVLTLLSARLIAFVLNVALVVAVWIRARFSTRVEARPASLRRRVGAIGALAVIVLVGYGAVLAQSNGGIGNVSDIIQTFADMNRFTWSPDEQVEKVGVSNFFLTDVIGSVFRRFTLTPGDMRLVEDWVAGNTAASKAAAHDTGIVKGRNLIFIQVESLENSVMNKTIGGQEITPNLDALARGGLYFDNYYTQVGPGNTADAEFVTLDSLYPLSNSVAFIDYAGNTYDALPKLLDDNGYHTYVLHDDVPDFWNRSNIYPALGYETVISKGDFTPSGELIMGGVGDRAFFDQSAEKMQSFRQPFMATLITISSHTPFQIPPDLETLTIPAGSALTDTQKNYLEGVHYADAAIGAFISDLKREGLYDNSVIVIYGDHGSFTGISDALDTDQEKAATLADLRTNQVPMIILAPGTALHGVDSMPSSHLDLYPTVANLLGVKLTGHVFGQDLFNTKSPVETHVDPDTQAIRSILTPTLAFSGSNDGIFSEGTCYTMPGEIKTDLSACKALYDAQTQAVDASDVVVRGNLVPMLSVTASTTPPGS